MKGLPRLIRNFRSTHGLNQATLADLLGVRQPTVSRWERGLDNPTLAMQGRIRDVLVKASVDPNIIALNDMVRTSPGIMCTVTGEDLDMRIASDAFTLEYGDRHLSIPWVRVAKREGTELAIDLFRSLLKRPDLCQCHMEVEVDTWADDFVTGHCTGTRFEFDGTPMLVLDIDFYGSEELIRKGGNQGSYTSLEELTA